MSLRPRDAEIVIGIVARIGVETPEVASLIENILSEYGYRSNIIKVTDSLRQIEDYKNIPDHPMEERYRKFIGACNDLRRKTSKNDIMARLTVSKINSQRAIDSGLEVDDDGKMEVAASQRRAFILNQLKRPEETVFLRSLYGEHYVQISCHSSVDRRARALSQRISHDHHENPKADSWIGAAHELIKVDDSEEDNPFGQRVRDVFPLSDVVIDASSKALVKKGLERFFSVLFGDYKVTPTPEEYGMQLAATAALRSSDLSRQVGAAILNSNNEIEALGSNEVPKAFGGTYWEGDDPDGREYNLGEDSNDRRKREVLKDLAFRMRRAGMLDNKYVSDDLLISDLFDRNDDIISDSQMMDSLEYGRTIHAEMNAITDAARNGHSIRGATLFCNTFPCHNCAKHIVASGIKRVVYLKPYPKSYASDLFSDSVSVDVQATEKVLFEQFIGINGPTYSRVFQKGKWKDDQGKVLKIDRTQAFFVRGSPIPAYVRAEGLLARELGLILSDSGIVISD